MVLVLGGGIGGLCAAYYALGRRPGTAVSLVEAGSRLGGWVRTTRTADGTLFEHGPRTIRPVGDNGANTLNLIEELGIVGKVRSISRSHPAAKTRLIYAKGALHALPFSLGEMMTRRAPFSRPLASALLTDLQTPRKQCLDESSYDFFARRLGTEVADYAVSPLLCGVCAGDAREITVKMLFRALFEAEQKHSTIVKGLLHKMVGNVFKPVKSSVVLGKLAVKSRVEKWSVYSLLNGLQTLPEVIEEKLQKSHTEIHLNDMCTSINFLPNGVEVFLKSGKSLRTNQIICSIPAMNLSSLVSKQHPVLAKLLSQQKNATVGVVNLQYRGNVLKNPAFGFLAPPAEKLPLLGVVFDSVCFPTPNGDTVVTAMMGGHWFHPQFTGASHEDLAKIAKETIAQVLGIKDEPIAQNVSVQVECIPQYTVGHYERLDEILDYIKNNNLPIHLIGSSYNGIGLNDVIMSARNAIDTVFK